MAKTQQDRRGNPGAVTWVFASFQIHCIRPRVHICICDSPKVLQDVSTSPKIVIHRLNPAELESKFYPFSVAIIYFSFINFYQVTPGGIQAAQQPRGEVSHSQRRRRLRVTRTRWLVNHTEQ